MTNLSRVLATALLIGLAAPAAAQTGENIYVGDGLVYYSLRNNTIVADDDRTKTNWDILINGIEIHANRAGLLLEEDYDSVAEAPEEGLGPGMMKTASGGTWYNYDMNDHVITPKPGMTFVLQLADDTYAKLEIQSYYHRITEEPRHVSFRYSIQEDGSRAFPEADQSGR